MKSVTLLFSFYSIITTCASQTRVSNGENAADGQFPYQAQIIKIYGRGNWENQCGASIIHKRWLLTAAHCIRDSRVFRGYTIVVGTTKDFGTKGQHYSIEKVITHERYVGEPTSYPCDIALIRLKTDIEFNKKVQPIKLPRDNLDKFEDEIAFISGLGVLDNPMENYRIAKILQYTWVPVIKQGHCKQYYLPNLRKEELCTLGVNGKSACPGDSGGPVVVEGTLVGIVSRGPTDCKQPFPNVHTRVSSYLDWIENKMSLYSDKLV